MTGRRLSPRRPTLGRRTLVGCTLLVTGVVGSARWVRGEDEQTSTKRPPISAKIADLAWIQGHWATKFGENELHEIWSPPGGECMMASFRWIKGGKVWMYELLTIAEDGDTIVFRFKHFSRELHGWEEKDEALTLLLVELGENLAVFESPGDGKLSRMVFRQESPTELTVRVGGDGEGGAGGLELKYKKER